MKIKEVHLKDFKRFTDLTIQGIPETAKLVVLLGPNGWSPLGTDPLGLKVNNNFNKCLQTQAFVL